MSCIQMKLNEAVSDTSLKKIDEWVIHVHSTHNRHINVHAYGGTSGTINVRIIGDGMLYTDDTYETELGTTTTLTTDDGWDLYLGQGDYDIYLSNKYKITYIGTLPSSTYFMYELTIDCKYLSYENYWGLLDLNGVVLKNFDRFAINKLYDVRLYNCMLGCDISLFVNNISPDVTMTRFVLGNDDSITGDATNLGTLAAFIQSPDNSVVSVRRSSNSDDQNLTGTYDLFCDKLFAAGKTSGTLRVHMPDDPVEDDPYLVTFTDVGWSRS